MTAPVDEELITLIKELQISKLDKDRSIMLLGDLLSVIITNNVPLGERWGAGMTIKSYIEKVKDKPKSATGFFGNWAKHHEDDISQIDINDSGC